MVKSLFVTQVQSADRSLLTQHGDQHHLLRAPLGGITILHYRGAATTTPPPSLLGRANDCLAGRTIRNHGFHRASSAGSQQGPSCSQVVQNHRSTEQARWGRRGFSLLELILALALSAMIMVAIGMAISLNLRVLDKRRGDVEEAQIARAVMQLIASDIRSAVQYEEVDFSGVMAMAGDVTDIPDVDDLLPDNGDPMLPGQEEVETVEVEEEETTIAESIAPPTKPGLYGDQFALQVDVSRLPRPDQYDAMLQSAGYGTGDIVSDVKTVAYYVQNAMTVSAPVQTAFGSPGGIAQQDAPEADASLGGQGLVRREVDRAIGSWSNLNGTLDTLQGTAKVIAPEVVQMTFMYFDGYQWLTEWDSDALGGLPVAVEIRMYIVRDAQAQQPFGATIVEQGEVPDPPTEYRLVVNLPVAEPFEEEVEPEPDSALGVPIQ